MNFISHLRRSAAYESARWHNSKHMPLVSFGVRKVSLANRLDLVSQVRESCHKYEFLRAGDNGEQSEAAMGDLIVKKLYLDWGLGAVKGLTIDGRPATTESLIASGPEQLADEIIEQIRCELGLNEQERKNF